MLFPSIALTCQIMLAAAIGSAAIACVFAWGARGLAGGGRTIALCAMSAGAVMPLFVHASGWEATWGKFGWIPMVQANTRAWDLSGLAATIWIHLTAGAAGASLIAFWGWGAIPVEIIDAARLDGGRWRTFFKVALPLRMPALLAAGAWSALLVLTDLTVADLYSRRTLPDLVYQQFALREGWLAGLAATLLAMILVGLLGWIVRRWQRLSRGSGLAWERHGWSHRRQAITNRAGGRSALWGYRIAVLLTVGLVIVAPLLGLCVKAGWSVELHETGVVPTFSSRLMFATFWDAIPRFRSELVWSAAQAGLVMGLAVPLAGALVAWSLPNVYRRQFVAAGILFLAFIPGPMVALAIVWLCQQSWIPGGRFLYDRTLVPTAIACLPRSLAVAAAVFAVQQFRVERRLHEMARLEGASPLFRWLRIDGGTLFGAVMVASLLAALLALGDLSANLLVSPPSVQTVAVRLFGLLHSGIRRQEAGLCLVTLAFQTVFVSAMLGLYALVVRRRASNEEDANCRSHE